MTKRTILSVLCGIIAIFSTSHVNASPIVNWGGDYTSSNLWSQRGKTDLSKGILYAYNTATPISPSTATTDYSGTSSRFYGAVHLVSQNGPVAPSGNEIRVLNNGEQDYIYIRTQTASASNPTNARGLLFWKKSDFLNGKDSENLSLSDLGKFTINVSQARSTSTSIRFAVQGNDGTWYLSETALTGSRFGEAFGTFSLDAPATSMWGVWNVQGDPTSAISADSITYNVNGQDISDIVAVGFFFDANYNLPNAAWLGFDRFTVEAIPEAGSVALLSAGGALLAGGRLIRKARVKK